MAGRPQTLQLFASTYLPQGGRNGRSEYSELFAARELTGTVEAAYKLNCTSHASKIQASNADFVRAWSKIHVRSLPRLILWYAASGKSNRSL